MLEVIDKGSCSEAHPVPLLFVHGSWHGAWCWDEHFLDFFADKGYRAVALSLRGHGASPGKERLRWTGIQEYVDDVAETAAQLQTQSVLVGHSMGGFGTRLTRLILTRSRASMSSSSAPSSTV